jgi:hypothetical protein
MPNHLSENNSIKYLLSPLGERIEVRGTGSGSSPLPSPLKGEDL